MSVIPLVPDQPSPPTVPETVLDWVGRLTTELELRQPMIRRYGDYYDGRHPLAFASAKWRKEFAGLFTQFADNWCQLVVDAVEERLDVEGFRLGSDVKSDADAWAFWQRSGMDAQSQMAHTEALIYADSYVSVWPDDDGEPIITVESPAQVIVALSSADRRKRLAAWKRWLDDDGYVSATLYLPEALYKFRSRDKLTGWPPTTADEFGLVLDTAVSWVPREVSGEAWPLRNPLGVVPVVPLTNRPRLTTRGIAPVRGQSEIHNVTRMQDAINKTMMDMLIASDFQGFRQRWATGLEVPVDPETKKPVEPFDTAVSRLWSTAAPDAKFGDFEQTDLGNYVKAVELMVQHVASQTRTPPHYFYLTGQFPSGEALKSAEAGLVAKARRKMRHFGEAWEEVIRLCFSVKDDARADITDGETIWSDPETRTDGVLADSAQKRAGIGVPWRQSMEDLGYSQVQIARMETERASDALLTSLLRPAAPAVAPPPAPGRPPMPMQGQPMPEMPPT